MLDQVFQIKYVQFYLYTKCVCVCSECWMYISDDWRWQVSWDSKEEIILNHSAKGSKLIFGITKGPGLCNNLQFFFGKLSLILHCASKNMEPWNVCLINFQVNSSLVFMCICICVCVCVCMSIVIRTNTILFNT